MWYEKRGARPVVDGRPFHERPPDEFNGKPQTLGELLVATRDGGPIHMVIWGEIPPDLSTMAPWLQRLELRETPQHSIDK